MEICRNTGLVDVETAKLLKSWGYSEPTLCCYAIHNRFTVAAWTHIDGFRLELDYNGIMKTKSFTDFIVVASAPTVLSALKWIYEELQLDFEIICTAIGFNVTVYDKDEILFQYTDDVSCNEMEAIFTVLFELEERIYAEKST